MTDAQTILKLIETVDPADTANLDEIDARVWAYLKLKGDFKISFQGGSIYYRHNDWPETSHTILHHSFQHPQYTRSRDALKAIRPEGYFLICNDQNDPEQFRCEFLASYKTPTIYAYGPTEELAELHAIIQAIAYVRGQ